MPVYNLAVAAKVARDLKTELADRGTHAIDCRVILAWAQWPYLATTPVLDRWDVEPFRLHTLRHTWLTRWAPHMDPWTPAYLNGHRDMSITKRYIHAGTEHSGCD